MEAIIVEKPLAGGEESVIGFQVGQEPIQVRKHEETDGIELVFAENKNMSEETVKELIVYLDKEATNQLKTFLKGAE